MYKWYWYTYLYDVSEYICGYILYKCIDVPGGLYVRLKMRLTRPAKKKTPSATWQIFVSSYKRRNITTLYHYNITTVPSNSYTSPLILKLRLLLSLNFHFELLELLLLLVWHFLLSVQDQVHVWDWGCDSFIITLNYITLHYTMSHYITLNYVTLHYNTSLLVMLLYRRRLFALLCK